MVETLAGWDIAVIGFYFVCVISVGLLSMCRSNRGNAEGYFLAGGSMLWLPVGASLFASNIGSEHFVGLAGSGALSGIAVAAFELNALLILQLLGWVFLPVYLAGGVYTMPEYLQKRFGGQRIRMYIAFLSLLLYIFTKISVDLFSGATFIQQALGWNLYPSILSLLAITAIYTVTGGLAAVIFTDTVQAFIMIGGAAALAVLSYQKIGGYSELESQYMKAYPNETLYGNNSCGYPREDSFSMLRAPRGSDLPWPGFLLGQTAASIWYWAADQVIVQRALAAKNLSHGKGGTLFAGLCKITPLYFIVFPGMVARILFPDQVACVDPDVCMDVCGSEAGCSNLAYPLLVMEILPTGLRGLMLAVMLSALTSSLTSIFNSGSTIFTMDIWRRLRKFPSETEMQVVDASRKRKYELELMIVGRLFVLVLIVISVLWIPVVQNSEGGQLFHYIQEISAYLSPPIAAVFCVGLLWERINETGAFWSLMVGLLVGLARMIIDFVWEKPGCGHVDDRPAVIAALQFHYMYFALMLFLLTLLCAVLFSLLSTPIPKEYLYRLTFWTRFDRSDRKDIDVWNKHRSVAKATEAHDNNAFELNNSKEKNSSKNGKPPVVIQVADPSNEKISRETEVEYEESKGICQKFYECFCGFSTEEPQELSEDEKRQREVEQMDKIHQTKQNSIILNIGLFLIVSVGVFMYGWYA